MNPSEGLKRIAQLARWIGTGLAAIIFSCGAAIAIFGNPKEWFFFTLATLIAAAIVYGVGRGLGWVIDGFAEPKESK
jgi:4-hydroxybenzoate polyprenyltransferase